MHELGIVFHVIKSVEKIGEENGLTNVASVTLELGEVYCEGCGRDYPTVQFGCTCPHCGSEKTWLKQGSEINLKEIEAI